LLSNRVPTEGAQIFVRAGGSGPPLLLHGHPQSHVCWHRIAPELARHVTLVIADSRGYGSSSAPPGDAEHKTYSKQSMAVDCLAVSRRACMPCARIIAPGRVSTVSSTRRIWL